MRRRSVSCRGPARGVPGRFGDAWSTMCGSSECDRQAGPARDGLTQSTVRVVSSRSRARSLDGSSPRPSAPEEHATELGVRPPLGSCGIFIQGDAFSRWSAPPPPRGVSARGRAEPSWEDVC